MTAPLPGMPGRHVRLTILGLPIQQGSKTPGLAGNGRPYLRDANSKELKPWREHVSKQAARMMGSRALFDGPIQVRYIFSMDRPRSVKREHPCVIPDWDKLARAVGDSLSKTVYTDDSRVVRAWVEKVYAGGPNPIAMDVPGVMIDVWQLV